MILLAHFARRAASLRAELRDLRGSYEAMSDHYRRSLLLLDAANEREADLRRLLEEAEHHLECMSCDNADLTRALDAMTSGLSWFEKAEGAK